MAARVLELRTAGSPAVLIEPFHLRCRSPMPSMEELVSECSIVRRVLGSWPLAERLPDGEGLVMGRRREGVHELIVLWLDEGLQTDATYCPESVVEVERVGAPSRAQIEIGRRFLQNYVQSGELIVSSSCFVSQKSFPDS
uniref:Uncharacterized protein n=1 Tax=Chromera velia CCMP2878 TaxID=1169474 RepID=A0A0G4I776_9ALVE|eukprot:Cvel_11587.t1-p1 / transcript=Cvel_11587.t1 / gene=Cvel_11587 / organism=Chromera_velia_CCMP2878 / gene_product=hypothetical protein / transcript_product=hypothetical protein / location=Cvel_scaffold733:6871-7287(+) / protein_length=139 / sequence_SO=supercontig / SO=protein_coding / is_pseudo=false